MLTVTGATYINNFRIRISLSDGTVGIADFRGQLNGPIFEPLNDPRYLARFELTDHTLQWDNGADFAPEYLRALITQTDSSNDVVQPSDGGDVLGDAEPTSASH